jgi:clan AA aspartic protease (TIGR02281 family)
MTLATQFDARQDLIYIEGTIASATKQLEVRLVLDTGASQTLIVPDIIEKLGYSARDAETRTSITSAVGREHGYIVRVARFATLGFAMSNFAVNVFDLAERESIHGLVGMNFLRRFNYQVRSSEGRILVSNIAPLAAR